MTIDCLESNSNSLKDMDSTPTSTGFPLTICPRHTIALVVKLTTSFLLWASAAMSLVVVWACVYSDCLLLCLCQ